MADWPLTPPDGSYQLGGGDYGYGQNMTEDLARSLFEIPEFNAANALTVLPELLLRLPLEALQRFQSFIPGGSGGAFNTVSGAVEAIMGALTDAPGAVVGVIETLLRIITGQSTSGAEGEAAEWFRSLLRGELFSALPIPALTNDRPNLLPSPKFEAGSINPNGDWEEGSPSRTDDGTFSAHAVANGSTQILRSGRTPADSIPVTSGQKFTASVKVRHTGYIGTGPALLLQVVPFTGTAAGEPVALTNEIVNPGGGSTVLVPAVYTPTLPDIPWPGRELSGSYIVPDGVTGIQLRVVLTRDATAGDFWVDEAAVGPNTTLPLSWMPEVQAGLQQALGRFQAFLDAMFNLTTGGDSALVGLDDLMQALQAIPASLISGVLGGADIGESLQAAINAAVGGLVGQEGTGASLPDLFNMLLTTSSGATQGKYAWEQWGIRDNKPVSEGLLATGTANYPYPMANTWLEVTQAASLCIVKREVESSPLGVVSFLAYAGTGVTACYINIRKIDPATSARTLIHQSPNIVGELTPTTPSWVFYNPTSPPAREQSVSYEYQIVPVGGSVFVRGMALDDDIPDHPDSDLIALGAVRNETSPTSPASSIAKSAVVSSPKVMWIETAIDTGSGNNYHDPITVYFNADGSIPIPNWAKFIDRVPVGAGGGARKGFLGGFFGAAGEPGKFNADTLERGTHFTNSDTVVTFVKGVGGANGSSSGSAGTASSFTVGSNTISAAGGAGGTDLKPFSPQVGRGPGSLVYNNERFVAGGDQKALGGDGTSPGGAGNGGDGFGFQRGGDGGDGGGWVRFRPGDVDGGGEIDITPPAAPTLSLDASTYSSLTVTASGATDA